MTHLLRTIRPTLLSALFPLSAAAGVPAATVPAGAGDPPRILLAAVATAIDEATSAGAPTHVDGLAEAVAVALTEDAKLTPGTRAVTEDFGFSVDLLDDRAIVGARGSTCATGPDCGAAYVFVFDGSSWVEEAKLTAIDAGPGDLFGSSVALSGDRALVGAPARDCAAVFNCGAAYVFAVSGGVWSQEAMLVAPSNAPFYHFGASGALSEDMAIVGAPGADCTAGPRCGAVHVFISDGASWIAEATLQASDAGAIDAFGGSVELSGSRVIVGAWRANGTACAGCGAAYVFAFTNGAWIEEAKLTASDGASGDFFGQEVSLAGNRAVVGAPGDDCAAGPECGSAYTFSFDGAWAQEARLAAGDAAAGDAFGVSVGVSGDRLLIGAEFDDCAAGPNCGSAYVFGFDGTSWAEQTKLEPPDASSGDAFGYPVALWEDRALVGASRDDCEAGPDCGAAYVFDLSTNSAPVAEAGDAQSVVAGQTVTLDGSGSSDPDGDPLTYAWQLSGPGSPELSDAAAVAPTFCAAGAGAYTASLVVNDGTVSGSPDEVAIMAVTPTTALSGILGSIQQLLAAGVLSDGQVRGLTRNITTAQRQLARGHVAGALEALAGFRQQALDLWQVDGALTEQQAATLIQPADAIVGALGSPCTQQGAAVTASSTTVEGAVALGAPYPNPARGVVSVPVELAEAGTVRLAVYDALGREVATLVDGSLDAGRHEIRLDDASLPTGIYLVRLTAGTVAMTQRLTLVR